MPYVHKPKPKFRAGDRVRRVEYAGELGTVREARMFTSVVEWDGGAIEEIDNHAIERIRRVLVDVPGQRGRVKLAPEVPADVRGFAVAATEAEYQGYNVSDVHEGR